MSSTYKLSGWVDEQIIQSARIEGMDSDELYRLSKMIMFERLIDALDPLGKLENVIILQLDLVMEITM